MNAEKANPTTDQHRFSWISEIKTKKKRTCARDQSMLINTGQEGQLLKNCRKKEIKSYGDLTIGVSAHSTEGKQQQGLKPRIYLSFSARLEVMPCYTSREWIQHL